MPVCILLYILYKWHACQGSYNLCNGRGNSEFVFVGFVVVVVVKLEVWGNFLRVSEKEKEDISRVA